MARLRMEAMAILIAILTSRLVDAEVLPVYLSPGGANVCDYGVPVGADECEAAVSIFAKMAGIVPGRTLHVGSGGTCLDGSWGQVPVGCSVQSGGDWVPVYKTGSDTGKGCIHSMYQLVCALSDNNCSSKDLVVCHGISNITCLAFNSARKKCPYTCGECICRDDPVKCVDANHARCEHFPEMNIICPLSCGLCRIEGTPDQSTEAPTQAPTTGATQAPPPQSDCGVVVGSIVGGSEVTPYSLPWTVGLVSPGSGRIWCGGTLIGPNHVLTAAHCMGYDFEIIVGEHDINSQEDGTRHTVCGTTSHPNYNAGTTNYDFAIVRLAEPVQLGVRAMPACLADSSMGDESLGGQTVTVSGWGITSSGGTQATVLQSVNVPAMTNAECRNTGYGENQITDAMLCAGQAEGGIDSCQGDSGGPLTYTTGGKTYLVGVVSWGVGCASPGFPGVYARVTHVRDWIDQQMAITC